MNEWMEEHPVKEWMNGGMLKTFLEGSPEKGYSQEAPGVLAAPPLPVAPGGPGMRKAGREKVNTPSSLAQWSQQAI